MPPIITTETVFSLLNKINTNKSNGPDNIPNWVLKEYASILAVPVTSYIISMTKLLDVDWLRVVQLFH